MSHRVGPTACDVCGSEGEMCFVGLDTSHTLVCGGCRARQPVISEVLDVEGAPTVCGCRVEDEEEACGKHGLPTWAVWLGYA